MQGRRVGAQAQRGLPQRVRADGDGAGQGEADLAEGGLDRCPGLVCAGVLVASSPPWPGSRRSAAAGCRGPACLPCAGSLTYTFSRDPGDAARRAAMGELAPAQAGGAAGPRRQAMTATAVRGLSRFAEARGIPAGREFLLDYDVIEAFCVAGLAAGRPPPGARTGRRCTGSPKRRTARRGSGRRRSRARGRRRRTRRRSGQSWPPSRLPSATRRNAPRRWRWWCSASARGCGPASWWRCAAATSPGTAAR